MAGKDARMTRSPLSLTVILMLAMAGCSHEFRLTPDTGISGNESRLTSAQSMTVTMAQWRLAGELTQRTGREWKPGLHLFGDVSESGAPKGTIFFMRDNQLPENAFQVVVASDSILVRASSSKGFDLAIDALMKTLQKTDNIFFFPTQTLSSTI